MYKIKGIVIHGRQLGSRLGFPTANIAVGDTLGIDDGVYAAEIAVAGCSYRGMANLGYRPSIGEKNPERLLEVNLFDFDGNLYGCEIEVTLIRRIRSEMRFATLEDLKVAVDEDRHVIENYFRHMDQVK